MVFLLIQTSKAVDAGHELDYKTSIGEWKRGDIQYCRFPGYDLTYAHYCKFPSWGLQDLALAEAIHNSPKHYPFSIRNNSNRAFGAKPTVSDAQLCVLQKFLIANTLREYVNIQIYYAQLLRHYINKYSPLVLFSWWRNKISWNSMQLTVN